MKQLQLALLASLLSLAEAQENGFGASNQAGHTNLLGNSFPPIGVDAVYDYIVSEIPREYTCVIATR